MMFGVAVRSKTQWMVTVAVLCSASVMGLRSLHVISTGWVLSLFFAVVIPLFTIKAFVDFRQR